MAKHGYWSFIAVLCVCYSVCYGQSSTEDVDICETHIMGRARLARIKSPNFPSPVTSLSNCRCSVRCTEEHVMDISVKVLLNLEHGTNISIEYMTNGTAGSWPLGYRGTPTVSEANNLVIATNVSYVEVKFESHEGDKAWSMFQINVKASPQGALSVNCSNYPIQTDTASDTSDKQDNGILPALGKVCSPYLVIILGSMCAAFLLIILAVSITLCCVVPKKRKKYLEVIRRSRVMNGEVRPTSYTKNNTDAYIYDEAAFRKSQASYLEVPQLYSDNTSTLRVGQARNSVPLYANSETIQTQTQH